MEKSLEQLKNAIRESGCFSAGDRVAVAFSGGADSLCLLYGLLALREELNLDLRAFHVNHGLRGAESDGDAAAAEELCRRLGVPCCVVTVDAAGYAAEAGCSVETAARLLRYEALDRLCREEGGFKLAAAHNKSDLAETVLMRILRGTGPDGLAPMEAVGTVPGGSSVLCRPLLSLSGSRLRELCGELGLQPREDSTNGETAYLRNKVRLQLLPLLKEEYNRNIEDALVRLSTIAAEDRFFLAKLTEEALERAAKPAIRRPAEGAAPESEGGAAGSASALSGGALPLSRIHLNSLDPALEKRALAEGLRRLGMVQDLTEAHLAAACRLIAGEAASGELELPGGFGLRLVYDTVLLYVKTEDPFCLKEGSLTVNTFTREQWEVFCRTREAAASSGPAEQPAPLCAWFDLDRLLQQASADAADLSGLLQLRTRRPGDRIALKQGSQKLQDALVNAKVPKAARDTLPLVALGSQILWIPGLRRSGAFSVTDETTKILYLEYKA
ncbi:MAG: tRNA lysidine(34) synthetase TilS [Clostridiales bacterium]|nr:tRNA lysidine(34) synthetase TilS [Clostridiales bacterium]